MFKGELARPDNSVAFKTVHRRGSLPRSHYDVAIAFPPKAALWSCGDRSGSRNAANNAASSLGVRPGAICCAFIGWLPSFKS